MKNVDLICPGTTPSSAEIKAVKLYLKQRKINFRIPLEDEFKFAASKFEFPLIPAELRARQFIEALKNPDSNLIWCLKGGYGSAEILPFLAKLKPIKQTEPIIGFSDIVSISNFLIQNWGWEVICAPMVIQLALKKVTIPSAAAVFDLVNGRKNELNYRLKKLNSINKIINSEIVGGCISVLASHFGTKNQTDWRDKILFLEDEGEDGERLDRYFRQLLDVMAENKSYPKAILLGNFLQSNPHGSPKSASIKIAISKFARAIAESNLPVFENLNLGHTKNMQPLILGRKAIIDNEILRQDAVLNYE